MAGDESRQLLLQSSRSDAEDATASAFDSFIEQHGHEYRTAVFADRRSLLDQSGAASFSTSRLASNVGAEDATASAFDSFIEQHGHHFHPKTVTRIITRIQALTLALVAGHV
jgi:hypothetical protein